MRRYRFWPYLVILIISAAFGVAVNQFATAPEANSATAPCLANPTPDDATEAVKSATVAKRR